MNSMCVFTSKIPPFRPFDKSGINSLWCTHHLFNKIPYKNILIPCNEPCNEYHQTNNLFSTRVLSDDEKLTPLPPNTSKYDKPTTL
jgi:hypothetical protein